MKKVLSTVAALGLVAGLASTAAAVEFKMSGKYLVEGAYLSDSRGTGVDTTETAAENATPTSSYWLHTFEIKPTMVVNDKVSMTSVVRLADDTLWGSQDDVAATGSNVGPVGGDVYVHQLYMDYASPIGKVRVGRTPAGTYGTNFMDSDKRADRVMLWNAGLEKPWSTLFYIEKVKDNQGPTAMTAAESAADSDTYVARLYYNTDTVDAGIHYGYTNNMTSSSSLWASADTASLKDEKHQLTAYGKFKLDNYFINGELTHFMGSVDTSTTTSRDYDSWAGMLQIGGKFDALTPSLMYFYAQGQDRTDKANANGDISNALGYQGTGDMFEPLYILTGRHTGMLNNDLFSGQTGTMSEAGVHAVVAAVDYAVSKDLTLHGAIGWAKADEVQSVGQDDSYGWEYNVGAAYKLLDNLTYEAHFGFADTGDYVNGAGNTTDITNNVYILTHSLTMTF